MLRLLLALLALVSPAAAVLAGDAEPRGSGSAPADEAGWIPLDMTLPASTGWVAVPVTALEDTLLDVNVTSPGARADEPHHASMLLAPIEDDERFTGFGAGWGEASDFAQVNVDGERVACCNELFGPFSTPGEPGWSSMEGFFLLAGQTAWFTLIAANADPATPPEGRILVREGSVEIGAPRSGLDVALLDLTDEAYRNGANVRLGEMTLGAAGGTAHEWQPKLNGLLFVQYWAHGGAEADVSVTAAGDAVLENVRAEDGPGMVFSMGTGAFGVELRHVREPPSLPFGPSVARLSAMALFADIDVPGEGTIVHAAP